MLQHLKLGFGVLVLLCALASPASAARLALVIGNDDYVSVTRLERAVADSQALRTALEKLGFNVTLADNLDFKAMTRTIAEFEAKIAPGDEVVFEFSGHGVAIDGRNYLLPVDVEQPQAGGEAEIKSFGRDAGQLVDDLRAKGPKLVFAILDACRDNPFQSASRSIGSSRGLARMDPDPGAFILFSAGPGEEALDRLGTGDKEATSVFTRVLLKYLDMPGITLQKLAKLTQGEVSRLAGTVGHTQFPDYFDRTVDEPSLSVAVCTASPANAYVGTWGNTDPQSGVDRTIVIRQSCQSGRTLYTFEESWACRQQQQPCHLGTRPARLIEKTGELVVDGVMKDTITTFKLKLSGPDAMKVDIVSVFTDDSGRDPRKASHDYVRRPEGAVATAGPAPAPAPPTPSVAAAPVSAPPVPSVPAAPVSAPQPAPTPRLAVAVQTPAAQVATAVAPVVGCDRSHLAGLWRNADPHARSIVRLLITSQCDGGRPSYSVEAWGACRPVACDWGMAPGVYDVPSGQLNIRHVSPFAVSTLNLRPAGGDALDLTRSTVFVDRSGRSPFSSDDVLVRAAN